MPRRSPERRSAKVASGLAPGRRALRLLLRSLFLLRLFGRLFLRRKLLGLFLLGQSVLGLPLRRRGHDAVGRPFAVDAFRAEVVVAFAGREATVLHALRRPGGAAIHAGLILLAAGIALGGSGRNVQ